MENLKKAIYLLILIPIFLSWGGCSLNLQTMTSFEDIPSPSTTTPVIPTMIKEPPPTATIPIIPAPTEATSPPSISMPAIQRPLTTHPSIPCVIPRGDPGPFLSSDFKELPKDILQYLNAGGNPQLLLASLKEKISSPYHYPVLVEKDFTGDGLFDIALTVIDPETEFEFTSGALIFYRCKGDLYESTEIMVDMGNPVLLSSNDMTKDGIPDLIVAREGCGAHTCYIEGLQVLIWNGETWENRLQGSVADIYSPTIEVFPNNNEILITGGSIASIGAGPTRIFMRRWTWDAKAGAFLPSPDIYFPSEYRIHALLDADQAALDEDYDRAIEIYTKVIEVDELLDWIVIEEDIPIQHARLGAYASFRLMIVYLRIGDFEAAEATYASIMTNYLGDNHTSGLAQMTEEFWVEYRSSKKLGVACLTALSFVKSNPATTIDLLYFGYANPEYEPEDMCPYSE